MTKGELVERLRAARDYSRDEKVALATLTHFILTPDCGDFTADHARHVLNILARYEPPAREAATALSEQAARIEELELELDAVKAFGVGFYAPNVEEATREAYRSIARGSRRP